MIRNIVSFEFEQAYSNSNILRKKSEQILDFNENLINEIKDLRDTFENIPKCVGIAAPQIGLFKNIIMINMLRSTEDSNHIIAINPEVIYNKGEFEGYYKGCASILGFKGFVKRQLQAIIKYQDITGKTHLIETDGFLTRIFLHEIDHLNGILFIDKVEEDSQLIPFNL